MHIFSRRPWLRVLVSALIGTMAVGTSVLVRAQSPSPTGYLENVDPEYPPSPLAPYPGSMGIVVEGLGYGSCSGPTLQQIESVTEQSIEDHYPTVTELSIESSCASIAQYEQYIQQITQDIYNYLSGSYLWAFQNYWKGFMLDEETGWGFTATDYQTLNNWASGYLQGYGGGIAYVMSEWYVCSYGTPLQPCWPQSSIDSMVQNTISTPQIANTGMVQWTNAMVADIGHINAVTFSDAYGSPWNTLSYTSGQVNGAPWYQWSQYLGNHFVRR